MSCDNTCFKRFAKRSHLRSQNLFQYMEKIYNQDVSNALFSTLFKGAPVGTVLLAMGY